MSAEPKQYNIATLIDIARIPPDRIPDLLAQLPRLLDSIRPIVSVVDEVGEENARLIAKSLIWIDDGISDGSGDSQQITFVPMEQ